MFTSPREASLETDVINLPRKAAESSLTSNEFWSTSWTFRLQEGEIRYGVGRCLGLPPTDRPILSPPSLYIELTGDKI